MGAQCHTGAPRGKRIWVVLKDGTKFIDRFVDRSDKYVIFKDRGWVAKGLIKSFSMRPIHGGS